MYVVFSFDGGEILAYPIISWSTENGQPIVILPEDEALSLDLENDRWLWYQPDRPEQPVEILEMAPDLRRYLPDYLTQWQSRHSSKNE